MIQVQGLDWPDDVGTKWRHALKHVRSLDWAMARCRQTRTAVQAGGNVGLWPRRLAERFARVITFEPDAVSRECLQRNVPPSVEVRPEALGRRAGTCGLQRLSLGSHHVVEGSTIPVTTIDALNLYDLDLLQLDIEGYEWHALDGARETLHRCHPIVQVEIRANLAERFDNHEADVVDLLWNLGYREVSRQPGNDVVFESTAWW